MTMAGQTMSQRPEYFVVGNRSFETHPSIDENLGKTEHRLKCGHLLSIDASIPHTDIRHCIVLGINPNVISSVTLQCADRWYQSLLAVIEQFADCLVIGCIETPKRDLQLASWDPIVGFKFGMALSIILKAHNRSLSR